MDYGIGVDSEGEGFVKSFPFLIWFLFLPLICNASTQLRQQANAPFRPGERLTFQLSWEHIPVGTAVLEVLPMKKVNQAQVHHFAVTIKTNKVIDKLYRVRDRIDAYASADMGHSVLFKKRQQEGSRERDVAVLFDWENMTVQYTNFGKARKPVAISPGTFDPVSLFYAFRLQDLKENTTLQAPVTSGKSLIMGTAQILAKENVSVNGKIYEAFLVEPDIKDAGGVFEHSEDSKLRVWITSDDRRIPVKVICRAPVGHFIGELVAVENP